MSEWLVAIIIVGVSILVAMLGFMACRTYGLWEWLLRCFGEDEEKAMLTKNEQYSGYMVTEDDDDLKPYAPSYESVPGQNSSYRQLGDIQTWTAPHPDKAADAEEGLVTADAAVEAEPASGATSGISSRAESPAERLASDISSDGLQEMSSTRLSRAISCDSVNSESSVLEETIMHAGSATCGILECGFEYDREVSELVVSVIQGKNLVLSDNAGSFDSYVKVMLLPDKEAKHQTKVQRKTNNPVFKERFHFVVEPQQLDLRTVRLFVHGNDKFQRNVLIGDAEVKLSDVDLIRPFSTWFYLRDASVGKQNDLGDIMFSLSYLPTAERLTIVIVKARNLKYSDQKQNGDSFVKVYLLQNGKKINKKKTTTKRGECNPIFNEAMIFNVSAQILQSIQLRISISEMAADGEQLTVGHVIVGSSTSGKTLSHWNQMMTSLRKPIAMWHTVRK